MEARWELELDRETFLARHWQRTPLLIRSAIRDFRPPLSRHELAGLALEQHVESRILERVDDEWRLHHGPFAAADLRREVPWTLLVQAVDHYIPEVARLRRLVDFLPSWRVDDVMVSYAVDGGSVGPHYDNYDVFLLQGEGRRRWRLGQACDSRSPLLPHDTLRILRDFECSREYLLEPGDILYVPPGIAHWGIAEGECTTFSIGFRAPRINDMVSRWADDLLEQLDPELFFRDPGIEAASRAGEIRPQDLERVRAQLRAALDQATDSRWFGAMVTEPRYEFDTDDDDLAEARALLAAGPGYIELSPAARVAWQQEPEGITVFANGQARLFSSTVLDTLATLCGDWRLDGERLAGALAQADTARLLDYLLESGGIYVE